MEKTLANPPLLRRRTLLLSALLAPTARAWAAPSAAALLRQPVDRGKVPGIVAGLVNAKGRQLIAHGKADLTSGRAPDADTLFGLGSITKLFTALALADMVARGELNMTDPVQQHLPPSAHVPSFDGKPVTLRDLATYHPGLPGWPANLTGLAGGKPFPPYSAEQLYAALDATKLNHAPGTAYVYSNFGFGLLGLALAHRAGMTYEELIVSRVCQPLGMTSTRMALSPALQARLAACYDGKLKPQMRWDLPEALAGAGGFYSTPNDMLLFLEAAMGKHTTALAPGFAKMLSVRLPADKPTAHVAAGWFIRDFDGDQLIWKDGAVPGFCSVIGYSRNTGRGVFAVVNGEWGGLTDLGKHLLNPGWPLSKA